MASCCTEQKETEERGGEESDGIPKKGLIETYTSDVGGGSVQSPSVHHHDDDAAAKSPNFLDSRRGGYDKEQQEENYFSSGSGATEALSEMSFPNIMGQSSSSSSKKHHHHGHENEQPPYFHRIARGTMSDARQCDIEGHEHSQCCACHKAEDHSVHHQHGDTCENSRSVKTSVEHRPRISRRQRSQLPCL
ncbi:hypothetical protein R1flu_007602 [Riccia fluitans]|uniref:Uncharacterized protein n=1 Tax=Riccia fluitans TaxID=41844 RepID=A0ABD1YZB9_9MARC